jgi:hypothetical protein
MLNAFQKPECLERGYYVTKRERAVIDCRNVLWRFENTANEKG